MATSLVRAISNLIKDTPLEEWARRIYVRFSHAEGLQYERQVLDILRQVLVSSSNCIDIGAYRGGVLGEMIRLAPQGTHFAFEPIPENYRYLVATYPRAHIFQVALAEEVQQVPFQHVISRPTYSGMHSEKYLPKEKIEVITVQTQCLDNLIPPDMLIDLIKVDVEGAEWGVFKGGIETIRRTQPVIVFEHGLISPLYYDRASGDIYDLLTAGCNLEIALMSDWLQGRAPLMRQAFIDEVSQKRNYYFIAYPPGRRPRSGGTSAA